MTKAEKTRQMILDVAAPVFNEKGVAGTSVDDVLRVAKVAKGCLYSHFENKEALSYAVIDTLLQKTTAHTLEKLSQEKTAKRKLFAFIRIYEAPLNMAINGGCPILNFAVEADDTNPIIKEKIQGIIKKSIWLIASIINKGIAEKEFSPSFDADVFAVKMFAMIEGGIAICRALNSNEHMQTITDILKKEIKSYRIK